MKDIPFVDVFKEHEWTRTCNKFGLRRTMRFVSERITMEFTPDDFMEIREIVHPLKPYRQDAYTKFKMCSGDEFVTAFDFHDHTCYFPYAKNNGEVCLMRYNSNFNDKHFTKLSCQSLFKLPGETINNLKFGKLDKGLAALSYYTGAESEVNSISVVDLVQPSRDIVHFDTNYPVRDFCWTWYNEVTIGIVDDYALRVADIRAPKSYETLFARGGFKKLAVNAMRMGELTAWNGECMMLFDMRRLSCPIKQFKVTLKNGDQIHDLQYNAYLPKQLLMHTNSRRILVMDIDESELLSYKHVSEEIFDHNERVTFNLVDRGVYGSEIINGRKQRLPDSDIEVPLWGYCQHYEMHKMDENIRLPLVWVDPYNHESVKDEKKGLKTIDKTVLFEKEKERINAEKNYFIQIPDFVYAADDVEAYDFTLPGVNGVLVITSSKLEYKIILAPYHYEGSSSSDVSMKAIREMRNIQCREMIPPHLMYLMIKRLKYFGWNAFNYQEPDLYELALKVASTRDDFWCTWLRNSAHIQYSGYEYTRSTEGADFKSPHDVFLKIPINMMDGVMYEEGYNEMLRMMAPFMRLFFPKPLPAACDTRTVSDSSDNETEALIQKTVSTTSGIKKKRPKKDVNRKNEISRKKNCTKIGQVEDANTVNDLHAFDDVNGFCIDELVKSTMMKLQNLREKQLKCKRAPVRNLRALKKSRKYVYLIVGDTILMGGLRLLPLVRGLNWKKLSRKEAFLQSKLYYQLNTMPLEMVNKKNTKKKLNLDELISKIECNMENPKRKVISEVTEKKMNIKLPDIEFDGSEIPPVPAPSPEPPKIIEKKIQETADVVEKKPPLSKSDDWRRKNIRNINKSSSSSKKGPPGRMSRSSNPFQVNENDSQRGDYEEPEKEKYRVQLVFASTPKIMCAYKPRRLSEHRLIPILERVMRKIMIDKRDPFFHSTFVVRRKEQLSMEEKMVLDLVVGLQRFKRIGWNMMYDKFFFDTTFCTYGQLIACISTVLNRLSSDPIEHDDDIWRSELFLDGSSKFRNTARLANQKSEAYLEESELLSESPSYDNNKIHLTENKSRVGNATIVKCTELVQKGKDEASGLFRIKRLCHDNEIRNNSIMNSHEIIIKTSLKYVTPRYTRRRCQSEPDMRIDMNEPLLAAFPDNRCESLPTLSSNEQNGTCSDHINAFNKGYYQPIFQFLNLAGSVMTTEDVKKIKQTRKDMDLTDQSDQSIYCYNEIYNILKQYGKFYAGLLKNIPTAIEMFSAGIAHVNINSADKTVIVSLRRRKKFLSKAARQVVEEMARLEETEEAKRFASSITTSTVCSDWQSPVIDNTETSVGIWGQRKVVSDNPLPSISDILMDNFESDQFDDPEDVVGEESNTGDFKIDDADSTDRNTILRRHGYHSSYYNDFSPKTMKPKRQQYIAIPHEFQQQEHLLRMMADKEYNNDDDTIYIIENNEKQNIIWFEKESNLRSFNTNSYDNQKSWITLVRHYLTPISGSLLSNLREEYHGQYLPKYYAKPPNRMGSTMKGRKLLRSQLSSHSLLSNLSQEAHFLPRRNSDSALLASTEKSSSRTSSRKGSIHITPSTLNGELGIKEFCEMCTQDVWARREVCLKCEKSIRIFECTYFYDARKICRDCGSNIFQVRCIYYEQVIGNIPRKLTKLERKLLRETYWFRSINEDQSMSKKDLKNRSSHFLKSMEVRRKYTGRLHELITMSNDGYFRKSVEPFSVDIMRWEVERRDRVCDLEDAERNIVNEDFHNAVDVNKVRDNLPEFDDELLDKHLRNLKPLVIKGFEYRNKEGNEAKKEMESFAKPTSPVSVSQSGEMELMTFRDKQTGQKFTKWVNSQSKQEIEERRRIRAERRKQRKEMELQEKKSIPTIIEEEGNSPKEQINIGSNHGCNSTMIPGSSSKPKFPKKEISEKLKRKENGSQAKTFGSDVASVKEMSKQKEVSKRVYSTPQLKLLHLKRESFLRKRHRTHSETKNHDIRKSNKTIFNRENIAKMQKILYAIDNYSEQSIPLSEKCNASSGVCSDLDELNKDSTKKSKQSRKKMYHVEGSRLNVESNKKFAYYMKKRTSLKRRDKRTNIKAKVRFANQHFDVFKDNSAFRIRKGPAMLVSLRKKKKLRLHHKLSRISGLYGYRNTKRDVERMKKITARIKRELKGVHKKRLKISMAEPKESSFQKRRAFPMLPVANDVIDTNFDFAPYKLMLANVKEGKQLTNLQKYFVSFVDGWNTLSMEDKYEILESIDNNSPFTRNNSIKQQNRPTSEINTRRNNELPYEEKGIEVGINEINLPSPSIEAITINYSENNQPIVEHLGKEETPFMSFKRRFTPLLRPLSTIFRRRKNTATTNITDVSDTPQSVFQRRAHAAPSAPVIHNVPSMPSRPMSASPTKSKCIKNRPPITSISQGSSAEDILALMSQQTNNSQELGIGSTRETRSYTAPSIAVDVLAKRPLCENERFLPFNKRYEVFRDLCSTNKWLKFKEELNNKGRKPLINDNIKRQRKRFKSSQSRIKVHSKGHERASKILKKQTMKWLCQRKGTTKKEIAVFILTKQYQNSSSIDWLKRRISKPLKKAFDISTIDYAAKTGRTSRKLNKKQAYFKYPNHSWSTFNDPAKSKKNNDAVAQCFPIKPRKKCNRGLLRKREKRKESYSNLYPNVDSANRNVTLAKYYTEYARRLARKAIVQKHKGKVPLLYYSINKILRSRYRKFDQLHRETVVNFINELAKVEIYWKGGNLFESTNQLNEKIKYRLKRTCDVKHPVFLDEILSQNSVIPSLKEKLTSFEKRCTIRKYSSSMYPLRKFMIPCPPTVCMDIKSKNTFLPQKALLTRKTRYDSDIGPTPEESENDTDDSYENHIDDPEEKQKSDSVFNRLCEQSGFNVKGFPGLLLFAHLINERFGENIEKNLRFKGPGFCFYENKIHISPIRRLMLLSCGLYAPENFRNFLITIGEHGEISQWGDMIFTCMCYGRGDYILKIFDKIHRVVGFPIAEYESMDRANQTWIIMKLCRKMIAIKRNHEDYRLFFLIRDQLFDSPELLGGSCKASKSQREMDDERKLKFDKYVSDDDPWTPAIWIEASDQFLSFAQNCSKVAPEIIACVYFMRMIFFDGYSADIASKILELKISIRLKLLFIINLSPHDQMLKNILYLFNSVQGLDRLPFVGLGYHEDSLRVLHEEAIISGDCQLAAHLAVIGRCLDSVSNKKLLPELGSEHINNQDFAEILQKFLEGEEKVAYGPPTLQRVFPKQYVTDNNGKVYNEPIEVLAKKVECEISKYLSVLDVINGGSYIDRTLNQLDRLVKPPVVFPTEVCCAGCNMPIYKASQLRTFGTELINGSLPDKEVENQMDIAPSSRRCPANPDDFDEEEVDEYNMNLNANGGKEKIREIEIDLPPSCSACQNCGLPLPKCTVCSISYLGSGLDMKGDINNTVLQDFSICFICKHGGHTLHLLQWFSVEPHCPVKRCKCRCTIMKPNNLTANQVRESMIQSSNMRARTHICNPRCALSSCSEDDDDIITDNLKS